MVQELFPDSIIVPTMSCQASSLPRICDKAFNANPKGDGMILLKHGIFTWSEDPREKRGYDCQDHDKAEKRIAQVARSRSKA